METNTRKINTKAGFLNVPSEIIPCFYVSSCHDAYDKKQLTKMNTSHILVCGGDLKTPFAQGFNMSYKKLPIQDIARASIVKFFLDGFKHFENFVKEKQPYSTKDESKPSCLVHCMAGCSRSVSMMTAYIMLKTNCKFDEVFEWVKEKRACSRPNKGFVEQLMYFEQTIDQYHKEKGYCKSGGFPWKVENFDTELKTLIETPLDLSLLSDLLWQNLNAVMIEVKGFMGVDIYALHQQNTQANDDKIQVYKQRDLSYDRGDKKSSNKKNNSSRNI